MRKGTWIITLLIVAVLCVDGLILFTGCDMGPTTYFRCYYDTGTSYYGWQTYEADTSSEAMDKCERNHAECVYCVETWQDEDGDWVTE